MEKMPSWEANRSSAGQEILRILRKPKVHYRIHNNPPTIPTLSQIDQVHAASSRFWTIYFKIILPSTHTHTHTNM
jgi:hypothetical protein